MFVNNINPDLITLGPFVIRFYGIVYALGFLLVGHFLAKKKIKNLNKEKAWDLVTYGLIGGLIGARLFHVISDFHLYQNNLIGIFQIWEGGLGFQGGLIGAFIVAYFYCKKHKINLLKVLDIVVLPMPLIIGFGRIANYINSEHFGHLSNLPWCVVFQKIDELCRHPAQIYQAISQFMLFGVLLVISKSKFSKKKGTVFWSFIAGYGFVRFITDFYRIGALHTQILSFLMLLIGIYQLYQSKK